MAMDTTMIVSVESRKGGVGKTTAALNLAKLFQERKYAVLFLDVDITGTNAADALDSPFWKDITHVVSHGEKKHSPANLLHLFQVQFMAGKGIAKCAFNGEGKDALTIAQDRINVLGSQIYDLNGSGSNGQARIICKPSILFDELHAFWFIEFLQGICMEFMNAFATSGLEQPIAIVIDNSPGYVGIAPAIQEWLTDLGPRKGKFLTVTSLDRQDLASCGNAVHGLHALFTRKRNTSRKYLGACQGREGDNAIALDQEEQAFFLRLAEGSPSRDSGRNTVRYSDVLSGNGLEFYRGNEQAALRSPGHYQGLLINRVPRLVKRGTYQYDQDEVGMLLHRSPSGVVRELLGDERGDYRQWMVSYDEYIEYQFIQSMISRRNGRRSHRQHYAEEVMERMMARRPIPSEDPVQEILRSGQEWNPTALDRLRQYIRNLHDIVLSGVRLLEQQGFGHLTRLIQDKWLPGNVLQDFRNAMRELLLDPDFPHFEFVPWEDDTGPVNPEAMELLEQLPHIIKRHIEKAPVPIKLVEQFVPSLAAVVGLSMSSLMWHSPVIKEFGELFAVIATAEATHWARRQGKMKSEMSMQRFLASDSLGGKDIERFRFEFHLSPQWNDEVCVSRLYSACACAQARLLDLRQDTEFLVYLMRRLVHEEVSKAPVLPYIRGVAEKVIVKKTTSHEAGHREIAKGFSSAQYMDEFSAVLERILKRWEGDA